MKRRSFLSLSAFSAVPAATVAGASTAAAAGDDLEAKRLLHLEWYKTVTSNLLSFKAVSPDDRVVLQVELVKPLPGEIARDKTTGVSHYKGKPLSDRYWDGQTLLTGFDLTWDGKPVSIHPRFWADLVGLDISTSTLDPGSVQDIHRWDADEFLNGLRHPRVTVSADLGTALVEWERGEECDGRSMIRWIISRSGTVLRHRSGGGGEG